MKSSLCWLPLWSVVAVLGAAHAVGCSESGGEGDARSVDSLRELGIDDGASGGELTSAQVTGDKDVALALKTGAEVTIPAGSVDKELVVTLKRPPDTEALSYIQSVDKSFKVASAPYVITPHKQVFAKQVEVTLPLSVQANPDKMQVIYLEDEKDRAWKPAGKPEVSAGKAKIKVSHFSVLMAVESQDAVAVVPGVNPGVADASAAGPDASHVQSDTGVTPSPTNSVFALSTTVYAPNFSTSYVKLVSSLDVPEITLADAREVAGDATIAKLGNWLFIGSTSSLVVDRFELDDAGALRPAGSIDFSSALSPEAPFDLKLPKAVGFSLDTENVFVSETKAYLFNSVNSLTIVWNPTTLAVTGSIDALGVLQDGYATKSVPVLRGNRVYRVINFANEETWDFPAAPQFLAVYDTDRDENIALLEDNRCPQLASGPFVDESGDLYFSGGVWTPTLKLTRGYLASCALRIKSGATAFDPHWGLAFASVTGGREAGVMRYLGSGKGLLHVFHHERTTFDSNSDPHALSVTPNWQLWTLDFASLSAAPLETIGFAVGGYRDVQLGARQLVMVQSAGYGETQAYDVTGGKVERRFKIPGAVGNLLQLR